MVFDARVSVCSAGPAAGTRTYQDLWWAAPAGSESGWGVNLTHQGDILFMTWFTYDATGRGMWIVGSRLEKNASGAYTGPLYRTRGPMFTSPQRLRSRTQVGTFVTFPDPKPEPAHGRGICNPAIVRMPAAPPRLACSPHPDLKYLPAVTAGQSFTSPARGLRPDGALLVLHSGRL
jgi:hypothetical protein